MLMSCKQINAREPKKFIDVVEQASNAESFVFANLVSGSRWGALRTCISAVGPEGLALGQRRGWQEVRALYVDQTQ